MKVRQDLFDELEGIMLNGMSTMTRKKTLSLLDEIQEIIGGDTDEGLSTEELKEELESFVTSPEYEEMKQYVIQSDYEVEHPA